MSNTAPKALNIAACKAATRRLISADRKLLLGIEAAMAQRSAEVERKFAPLSQREFHLVCALLSTVENSKERYLRTSIVSALKMWHEQYTEECTPEAE